MPGSTPYIDEELCCRVIPIRARETCNILPHCGTHLTSNRLASTVEVDRPHPMMVSSLHKQANPRVIRDYITFRGGLRRDYDTILETRHVAESLPMPRQFRTTDQARENKKKRKRKKQAAIYRSDRSKWRHRQAGRARLSVSVHQLDRANASSLDPFLRMSCDYSSTYEVYGYGFKNSCWPEILHLPSSIRASNHLLTGEFPVVLNVQRVICERPPSSYSVHKLFMI